MQTEMYQRSNDHNVPQMPCRKVRGQSHAYTLLVEVGEPLYSLDLLNPTMP